MDLGWGFEGGIVVDFGGAVQAEGFVRADVVEHLPVGLGLAGEVSQGGDLLAVRGARTSATRMPVPARRSGLGCGGGCGCVSSGRTARKAAKVAPLNAAPLSVTCRVPEVGAGP